MDMDDLRELMMKVSAHIIGSLTSKLGEVADDVVGKLADVERNKRVLKYELYKSKGAFQFRLMPAYAPGHKDGKPEGCVFIECSRSTGRMKYEFKEKKITFALNLVDIGQFITGVKNLTEGKSISIVHDPDAGTPSKGTRVKTFRITRAGLSNKEGFKMLPTYFIDMSMNLHGEKYDVKIPVEPFEMRMIQELLTAAIPRMLHWS